jgi:hypothetical protein
MLKAAIIFFCMGMGIFLLGINEVLGVSFWAGRFVLIVFVALATISLIAALRVQKR